MRIKTTELQEPALSWAVLVCQGHDDITRPDRLPYSQYWGLAGPLIERYQIQLIPMANGAWRAEMGAGVGIGPAPLVAAMREYVATVIGLEVDIPDELLAP